MTEGAVFDQALGAFQSGDLARARALAEAGLYQAESPQLLHLDPPEAAFDQYFEGLDSALPGSLDRLALDKLPLNMLAPGLIQLVFEDLVSDPEAALRPLVTFLGLEWRNKLLDHRATAQSRGAISTPSYDQVVRPLTKGPVGRLRNYERQLEPVLPVLLPWAERLGYRP